MTPIISDPLTAVRSLLIQSGGPDIARYRASFVTRRLNSRMRLSHTPTLAQYARKLEHDRGETTRLAHALSIGVTRFRRDSATFDRIEQHLLPHLLSGRGLLRCLSAGSATGEEAWTLALSASEQSRRLGSKRAIRVEGFDMDLESVQTARRGRYPRSALSAWPSGVIDRWFVPVDNDRIAGPELRSRVRFTHANVFSPRIDGRYQLVVCRNLFIYLTPDAQQAALETLTRAIAPGGFLVLGRTEHLTGAAARAFDTQTAHERIYQLRTAS